jgi:hypothetical protein
MYTGSIFPKVIKKTCLRIAHDCLYSILSAKEIGSYIKQYAVDCSDWELLEIVFNILNEETKGMAKGEYIPL